MRVVDNYSCEQRLIKVTIKEGEHQGKTGTIFAVSGSLLHGPRIYDVEFDDGTKAQFTGKQMDKVK